MGILNRKYPKFPDNRENKHFTGDKRRNQYSFGLRTYNIIIKNDSIRSMHIFYIALQRWIIFLDKAERIPRI